MASSFQCKFQNSFVRHIPKYCVLDAVRIVFLIYLDFSYVNFFVQSLLILQDPFSGLKHTILQIWIWTSYLEVIPNSYISRTYFFFLSVFNKLALSDLSHIIRQIYLHMDTNVENGSVNEDIEERNYELVDNLRLGLKYLNNIYKLPSFISINYFL